jgi:hypothetical protein
VRSLKEKEELKRQLEDLVVVERDQLVKTAASDRDQAIPVFLTITCFNKHIQKVF